MGKTKKEVVLLCSDNVSLKASGFLEQALLGAKVTQRKIPFNSSVVVFVMMLLDAETDEKRLDLIGDNDDMFYDVVNVTNYIEEIGEALDMVMSTYTYRLFKSKPENFRCK